MVVGSPYFGKIVLWQGVMVDFFIAADSMMDTGGPKNIENWKYLDK